MIPLAIVFALFAVIGLLIVILDFGAKMNNVTPSQYDSSASAWGLTIFFISGLLAFAAFMSGGA